MVSTLFFVYGIATFENVLSAGFWFLVFIMGFPIEIREQNLKMVFWLDILYLARRMLCFLKEDIQEMRKTQKNHIIPCTQSSFRGQNVKAIWRIMIREHPFHSERC